MSAGSARALFCLAALVAALLGFTRPAQAHQVGLSRGEYVAKGGRLTMTLAFSKRELAALAVDADADRDGTVSTTELEAARPALAARLPPLVGVAGAGLPCAVTLTDVVPDREDGFAARIDASGCAGEGGAAFVVDLSSLFDKLERGHRHAAFIHQSDGTTTEALLFAGAATLRVGMVEGAPAPEPSGSVGGRYLVLGIEHILGGLDHVLFLLGLLLVTSKLRHIAAMVTAFTVAHSITLGLAVLGILAPSPTYIEPLIALSVAYVGVENFFVKDAAKRWRLTAVFGLVHGFGFAGALGEVGVPTSSVPLALAAFNVGVEIGQIVLIAIALPAFHVLRKLSAVKEHGVRVASAAIALAGLFWFVTRVLGTS